MLQFEQFRFRCNRCNCSHINTAICHADVYLPTIVAFCQHIFQQMFAETRITRQFTSHPYIVHLRQNGRKRPAYLVHRPISISQQQHLCGRTSIKMLHHPPQGTRSLSGSRRSHQQEIVTGRLRFQRHPFKVIGRPGYPVFISHIKTRRTLPQQQLPALRVRVHKGRQSQIHASESSIHRIMLHGITAVLWKHQRILLCRPKTNAQFIIGYGFYISLEYHFVGHIIRTIIAFIEHHHVSITKIRQKSFFILRNRQNNKSLMSLRCMVLNNSKIV